MSTRRTRGSSEGDAERSPRSGGERGATKRTPKKKAGGARRTRQKARITKKTGDVRSKPAAPSRGRADGPLSGRAIRHLRGLGHHLDPVVQIGKDGITDAVVAATREQLLAHELIKVKIGTESPTDRKDAGPELATRTGATLAQILGRTLLLYRRHPNKPKIELPR